MKRQAVIVLCAGLGVLARPQGLPIPNLITLPASLPLPTTILTTIAPPLETTGPGGIPRIVDELLPGGVPQVVTELLPGGIPGVVSNLLPGGIPGVATVILPGGVPGVVTNLLPGGVPGVVTNLVPGGVPGVVTNLLPGGVPGVVTDLLPGGVPGVVTDLLPGGVPGVVTDLLPGGVPGVVTNLLPSGVPGVVTSILPGGTPRIDTILPDGGGGEASSAIVSTTASVGPFRSASPTVAPLVATSTLNTIVKATSTPVKLKITARLYLGCFEDQIDAVPLLTGKSFSSLSDLTQNGCKRLCGGYQFFGLVNGETCRCGNQLMNRAIPAPGECNVPASGSVADNLSPGGLHRRQIAAEEGGGFNRISLFRDESYVDFGVPLKNVNGWYLDRPPYPPGDGVYGDEYVGEGNFGKGGGYRNGASGSGHGVGHEVKHESSDGHGRGGRHGHR